MRTATSLLRGATIYLRTVHAVTSRAASRLKRLGHFCRALTVAREIGLSHPTPMLLGWGRRIVSEDSGHSVHPLPAAVHPFSESKNRAVLGVAQGALDEQADGLQPGLEVLRLLAYEHKALEERDDAPLQVAGGD